MDEDNDFYFCCLCSSLLSNNDELQFLHICSMYITKTCACEVLDTSRIQRLERRGFIQTFENDRGVFAIPNGYRYEDDNHHFCIDRMRHEMMKRY